MADPSKTRTMINAIETPLASIFGSGFLIIIPILAGSVGMYAVPVMAAVCALAYCVGCVIRFNIIHVEPVLAGKASDATRSLDLTADIALVLAYIVSVCLYLHILSSFVLGAFGVDAESNEDVLTTAVIVLIMVIGITKGLSGLSKIEKTALCVTLVIIALLILGFVWHDWNAWRSPAGFTFFKPESHTPWEIVTIVAGTLIVVQGFETTRYLGDEFTADVRVAASRWSQIISTVVYLTMIAAALPVIHTLGGKFDDNSLIKLVATAAAVLSIPLIVAAALSQFSAAIADTLAATGNMEDVTHGRLKEKFGTILVGGGAIALTWSANTLELVALASRAFAFYYLLQCLVAISVSTSMKQKAGMAALAAVLGFITIFAVPAS
jgi:hypothetical protein